MSVPVVTCFNIKGGVGKTSLVFHVAHMLAQTGRRVVAVDLDPQADLTAAFLDEKKLEAIWEPGGDGPARTVYQAIRPLAEGVGDIGSPETVAVDDRLHLLPGDLDLSGFEDALSGEWPNALGGTNLYRPFRILSSFWIVAQRAAEVAEAEVILADVGPNLGTINRSALIGSDHVVIPLAADLPSLQGLRNLGPVLRSWREAWRQRRENWGEPSFELPRGEMVPVGYVVHRRSVRLDRPLHTHDRWLDRIPEIYRTSVLGQAAGEGEAKSPADDPNCLATLKHYRSLIPMGQEVNKPIFSLTSADGAIGNHASAVQDAYRDYRDLAAVILDRVGLGLG